MSDNGFKAKFSGGGSGGSGTSITLKTNGTNNGSQSILNLANGTNITLADNGSGQVTINNTALANPVLKTANVNNSDQSILNLTAGSGIGIVAGATGLVTINNSATPITLKTNGTNNGSQSILDLTSGSGILITDDGVGGVTIKSSAISNNELVFSHIATISDAQQISQTGTYITYEIALPRIDDVLLWELESRFVINLLTNVEPIIFISSISGTIGTMIAKGSKFQFANDLSAINRTYYNSNNDLYGISSNKDGQPTDYADQLTFNNIKASYNVNFSIPQFLQFVVNIIDNPIPIGAFASLDFCKFTLTKKT